jgi:hypothetical protein
MLRITKEALQVATGKTDKDNRGTRMVSFSLQTVEYLINLPHRRQCLFRLLHLYLEASGYLVAYPTGYVLGCGIEGQHFIKIMMIQLFLYHLLDVTEVYHHSVRIQLFGTAIDSDNPVVTV